MLNSLTSTWVTVILIYVNLNESSIYAEWIFECLDTIYIEVWLEYETTESLSQSSIYNIDSCIKLCFESCNTIHYSRNLLIKNSCKLCAKSVELFLSSKAIMSSLKFNNSSIDTFYIFSYLILYCFDFFSELILKFFLSSIKLSLNFSHFFLGSSKSSSITSSYFFCVVRLKNCLLSIESCLKRGVLTDKLSIVVAKSVELG